MRVTRTDPEDVVGRVRERPTYRVRLWTAAARPGWAATVDEWDVHDAGDVTAVIEWAAQRSTGPRDGFEVFVSFPEPVGQNEDGTVFLQDCFVRLYGHALPEESATETVVLTRED